MCLKNDNVTWTIIGIIVFYERRLKCLQIRR